MKSRCPEGFEEDVFPRQIIRSLDNHEAGYGKVAAFEDCDPSLLIYRKFGWLHNRALLYLQDELSELEEDLIGSDTWDFADGDNTRLFSRRVDFAEGSTSYRRTLMPKIYQKLAEYDEFLLKAKEIQSIPRPSARAQRTLFRLIKNSQSLKVDEMDWVRFGPDLAALSTGVEHGWFSTALEDILNFFSRQLTTFVFRDKEQATMAGEEPIQLLSPRRFDILLRMVLTIIAAVLLLAPVSILFELQPSSQAEAKRMGNYQILTIFLFTLLFSASCSIFTRARRQEVFTATAAYCAVLVVFLGNTTNVVVATNGLLNQK